MILIAHFMLGLGIGGMIAALAMIVVAWIDQ